MDPYGANMNQTKTDLRDEYKAKDMQHARHVEKLRRNGVIESDEVEKIMLKHNDTAKRGYWEPLFFCVAKTLEKVRVKIKPDSKILVVPCADPFLVFCLADLVTSEGQIIVLHEESRSCDWLKEYQLDLNKITNKMVNFNECYPIDGDYDVIVAGHVESVPEQLLYFLKPEGRLLVCIKYDTYSFDKDQLGNVIQNNIDKEMNGRNILYFLTFRVPVGMLECLGKQEENVVLTDNEDVEEKRKFEGVHMSKCKCEQVKRTEKLKRITERIVKAGGIKSQKIINILEQQMVTSKQDVWSPLCYCTAITLTLIEPKIKPSMSVLIVPCTEPYLVLCISQLVGDNGTITVLHEESRTVEWLKQYQSSPSLKIDNVIVEEGDVCRPDVMFDVILAGHVERVPECFWRRLKPGGRLLGCINTLIHWHDKDDLGNITRYDFGCEKNRYILFFLTFHVPGVMIEFLTLPDHTDQTNQMFEDQDYVINCQPDDKQIKQQKKHRANIEKMCQAGIIKTAIVKEIMLKYDETAKRGFWAPFYHCIARTLESVNTTLKNQDNVLIAPCADTYLVVCVAELVNKKNGKLTVIHEETRTIEYFATYQPEFDLTTINNIVLQDNFCLSRELQYDMIISGHMEYEPTVFLKMLKPGGRLMVTINTVTFFYDKLSNGAITKIEQEQKDKMRYLLYALTYLVPVKLLHCLNTEEETDISIENGPVSGSFENKTSKLKHVNYMTKLREEGIIESVEVFTAMSNHDATIRQGYNKPFYTSVAKTLEIIKPKLRADSSVLVLPVAEPYMIACLSDMIGNDGTLTVLHENRLTIEMMTEYQESSSSALTKNLTLRDGEVLDDNEMFDVIIAGNIDTIPQVLLRRLNTQGRLLLSSHLEDLMFDKDDQGFVTKYNVNYTGSNLGVLDFLTFHVPDQMLDFLKFANEEEVTDIPIIFVEQARETQSARNSLSEDAEKQEGKQTQSLLSVPSYHTGKEKLYLRERDEGEVRRDDNHFDRQEKDETKDNQTSDMTTVNEIEEKKAEENLERKEENEESEKLWTNVPKINTELVGSDELEACSSVSSPQVEDLSVTEENPSRETTIDIPECSVCLNYMTPPTALCINGHTLCADCRVTITKCAICRAEYTGIKNYLLDSILENIRVPCKGSEKGCKSQILLNLVRTHEKCCKYLKTFKCRHQSCDQDIKPFQFLDHVIDHHVTLIDESNSFPVIFTTDMLISNWDRLNVIKYGRERVSKVVFEYRVKVMRRTLFVIVKLLNNFISRTNYEVKIQLLFENYDECFYSWPLPSLLTEEEMFTVPNFVIKRKILDRLPNDGKFTLKCSINESII